MDKERIQSLLDMRGKLSDFLYDHKQELQNVHAIRRLESSSWVIDLANSITLTTYAPTSWAPTRGALHTYSGHPPAPQFQQMRLGQLEKFERMSQASGLRDRIEAQVQRAAKMDVGEEDENVAKAGPEAGGGAGVGKGVYLEAKRTQGPLGVQAYLEKSRALAAQLEREEQEEQQEEEEEEDSGSDEGEEGEGVIRGGDRKRTRLPSSPIPGADMSTELPPAPPQPQPLAHGSARQSHMAFGGQDSDDEEEEEEEDEEDEEDEEEEEE
jgi:hypothetical protein